MRYYGLRSIATEIDVMYEQLNASRLTLYLAKLINEL
jgi:hypothetical protein